MNHGRPFLILFFTLAVYSSKAQSKTDSWLRSYLYEHASPSLLNVLRKPDSFQYQLIYTQIDRDSRNHPHLHSYFLNVDRNRYFNPASTVKLPLSILALQKINELHIRGLNSETSMLTDSSFDKQSAVIVDTSSANRLPSIAQYIRKIFLVSDNDAYNRLYEFLGQEYINNKLWSMGYKDVRITRRFVSMNEEQNRHTNAIRFVNGSRIIYQQPPAASTLKFDFSKKIFIGNAHYDRNDSLVHAPMDFTTHNNLPLEDLQLLLQSVLLPETVPKEKRPKISKEDYRLLYQYMSEYPSESEYPHYDTSEYFDSYCKFFLFRAGKINPPKYIRIFNKPGWSYGFLTDAAYIVDFKNQVEFMLSAVIYVNSDGILNDDKYEYEQIGWPFFKEVGNIIYEYELKRKRKYAPNLDRFIMQYK
jgi:hypothetical protein